MRTLAIEVKRKGVVVAALHPGTCDTELSKPFQKNVKKDKLFTPQYRYVCACVSPCLCECVS